VAIAAAFTACGKAPTQPTQSILPSAAPPTLTAIRLDGPTTLASGETGRLTAVAEWSDGSSQDVTATASWKIVSSGPDPNHSGSNVLQFLGRGTVQAVGFGEASINVQIPFQSHNPATSPTLSVLVLDPGTFRISGAVVSAGLPESATIEIISGTGSGLRTATGFASYAGQYALYGAVGSVELRVSASGFNGQVRRLVVTANTTSDFELNPLVPSADISGSWVATLSASPACRAKTPEAGWEREFNLDITQQGTRVSIARTSPTFYEVCSVDDSAFKEDGRILGQTLSFGITGDTYWGDHSYPCLFDRLNPTEWLGISGAVEATVSGDTIRGRMDTTQGAFDVYKTQSASDTPSGNFLKAICHAADHVLTLRRR
jgi:hypothetical protein